MKIEVDQEQKTVFFWLSRVEGTDAQLRQSLNPMFKQLKSRGYQSVVFRSGTEPLVEMTSALLRQNRRATTGRGGEQNDLCDV